MSGLKDENEEVKTIHADMVKVVENLRRTKQEIDNEKCNVLLESINNVLQEDQK